MSKWLLLLFIAALLITGMISSVNAGCSMSAGLSPCTGDISNAALFIGIAVVAAVVIVLSIVLSKKGKGKK